ncbi:MAG: hypothetical protein IJE08_02915 [Clostridia bacterium]|nr:hypothetical protein [Clostridia bacterium]
MRVILFYPIPLFSAGGTLSVLECVPEQPYSEQTHKRAWERIQRTIDMHSMIPYEGRYTYLTEMCEGGIDMKTMMNEKKANGDPQKNAAHDEQQITNQGKSVAVYVRKPVPAFATFEEQQESLKKEIEESGNKWILLLGPADEFS